MRNLFLTAVVILTGFLATAQSDTSKFNFGLRGGVNFATVAGDDFDSPDARTSFYAGAVLEVPIVERFSLQVEAFYSGQGFTIDDQEGFEDDVEFQVDYIQVPVLAKVYLIKGFNIQAGTQFGFKINEEIDSQPLDNGGDFNTDLIQDFDFQLTTGAEYKFSNGFFVQARFTYGLSELIEDRDVHNAIFSTGVGFMF